MRTPQTGTGDGSRPTTSGGVDNIGGGEKFSGKQTAGGNVSGPGPAERLTDKRKSADSSAQDDTAPLDLQQDYTPETNREAPPASTTPPATGLKPGVRRADTKR